MILAAIGFAFLGISSDHADKRRPATPVSDLLAVIQREYFATRSAKDPHSNALHSYLLNDAADQYAYEINQESNRNGNLKFDWQGTRRDTEAEIQCANEYGASIYRCEYDADWTADSQGYEDYLSRWPDGPHAEEAWWRSRLRHKLNSCFDAEGSEDETASFVKDYEDFLRHFPHGKHEREARQMLKQFQEDLDSYKRQEHR